MTEKPGGSEEKGGKFMLRGMFSGVSGLKTHQIKMDVIGNNIANVNTPGFKSGHANFKDVFYQTLTAATDATALNGGVNPSQIGYGTQINSIEVNFSNAGYMTSSSPTHCYINGEGFFVVQDSAGEYNYKRLGDFKFDGNGNLVDSSSNFVMGYPAVLADADGNPVTQVPLLDGGGNPVLDPYGNPVMTWSAPPVMTVVDNSDLQALSPIRIPYYDKLTGEFSVNDGSDPSKIAEITNLQINADGTIIASVDNKIVELGQICIAYVPNASALVQNGDSSYVARGNTGAITYHVADDGTVGGIISGALESSNVDLANEFTEMIITQRGFQANSRIITVGDEMLQELVNLKR